MKNKFLLKLIMLFFFLTVLFGVISFFKNLTLIASTGVSQLDLASMIKIYLGTILTVLFHEFGHGIACKYYGGEVNEIGFILICGTPALYCDVSGIRKFKKKKHVIITLLAGISVQIFITSLATIISSISGPSSHPLLNLFILWNIFMIFSNLLPITKLDGYWIISTLTNIPNLYDKSIKLALGRKNDVLFNQDEINKTMFIKIYGIINLVIMFTMVFGMIIGLSKINFLNANLFSIMLTVLQGLMGTALIVYVISKVIRIRKEN